MSDTDNTIKINDPSPQDRREECDKELIDSSVPGAAFGDKDAEPPLVPVDKDEIQEEAQPESESKVSGDDDTGYNEIKEIDPQPDSESDVEVVKKKQKSKMNQNNQIVMMKYLLSLKLQKK